MPPIYVPVSGGIFQGDSKGFLAASRNLNFTFWITVLWKFYAPAWSSMNRRFEDIASKLKTTHRKSRNLEMTGTQVTQRERIPERTKLALLTVLVKTALLFI